jgi:Tfp pilus assembly protein PilZ
MTLDTRTVDISFAGICVNAVAAVLPGKDVQFSLKLILEGLNSDSLTIPGRVAWCTPTEGQFQIGACFRERDMNDTTRNGLGVLLRFLSGELEVPSQDTEA